MSKARILCLHKISDVKYPSWPAMPLGTFEKLLKHISRYYNVCLPTDLHSESNGKSKLVLTFDDGYEDFYLHALPLLKKYRLPAVLNVVTECVKAALEIWTQRLNDAIDAYAINSSPLTFNIKGISFNSSVNDKNAEMLSLSIYRKLLPLDEQDRLEILTHIENNAPYPIKKTRMMSAAQLIEISDTNIIIASHSKSHINLKNGSLSNDVIRDEIAGSKKNLEHLLNKGVDIFAFPNGMYSERSLNIAIESGYKYILLVNDKLAHFEKNNPPFILDRILLYSAQHWKNLIKLEKKRFF